MPSSRLYGTRYADDGTTTLYAVDLETPRLFWLQECPKSNLAIAPTEDFAILTTYVDGPTEEMCIKCSNQKTASPGGANVLRLWRVDFASGIPPR